MKKGKDYMHLHTYISLSVKMESTWKRVKTICTYKLIYRVTPKDKRITLTTTLKVTSSSKAISTLCASSPLSPIKSSPMTLHVMLMTPALTSVQIKNKKTKKLISFTSNHHYPQAVKKYSNSKYLITQVSANSNISDNIPLYNSIIHELVIHGQLNPNHTNC